MIADACVRFLISVGIFSFYTEQDRDNTAQVRGSFASGEMGTLFRGVLRGAAGFSTQSQSRDGFLNTL
jgi:hypothetical protein